MLRNRLLSSFVVLLLMTLGTAQVHLLPQAEASSGERPAPCVQIKALLTS